MKNCPNCNAEIADLAVFCVHCQTYLAENKTAAAPQTEENICPNCGNVCDKKAVLCVKCGNMLPPKNKKASTNVSLPTSLPIAKIVSIAAAVLCGISLFSFVPGIFSGFGYKYVIVSIIRCISVLLLVAGFIIGKKNKLPAAGYFVSAFASLLYVIFYHSITFSTVLAVVQVIVTAMLFINGKLAKNIWFAPIALCVLSNIIGFATNIYYYFDYYYGFPWGMFFSDIVSIVFAILGVLVVCVNAKLNWADTESVQQ